MVNIKSANIFNGNLEIQKSTKNEKNNAKINANRTSRRRVYLRGIYLDTALGETHASLNHPPPPLFAPLWVDGGRAGVVAIQGWPSQLNTSRAVGVKIMTKKPQAKSDPSKGF
jgi:hypothetical protein